MPSGYTADLPTDILLDQGLLYVGNALVGATKDALRFNPGKGTRNAAFAGKKSPVAGLDRVTGWDAKITGTLLVFNETTVTTIIDPGASATTGTGATLVETITPADAGVILAENQLLANVRAIWPRAGGGFAAVFFERAFVEEYTLEGEDPGEAGVAVTIGARIYLANGQTPEDCPYKIEFRASLPA